MTDTQDPLMPPSPRLVDGPRPRLVEWLYKKAQERGHTPRELAHEIGMTFAELMVLASSGSETANLPGRGVRLIAQYLEIAPAAVWLLAGKLTAEDFVMPERFAGGGNLLLRGLHLIAHDPVIGPLVPQDAFHVSHRVEALLCALYNKAGENELFPEQRVPLFLQGLQDAAAAIAEQDEQREADNLDSGSVH